jgi:hypothetical protein
MSNVKTGRNNPETSGQKPSATRENKQIKSGLTRSVKGEQGKECCQKASHPKKQQKNQECLQNSLDEREAFVQKKGKAP